MRILVTIVMTFVSFCAIAQTEEKDVLKDSLTTLKVKGLNGFMINQKISFGDYKSSSIKRGWDFSSSSQTTKMKISREEMLLKVFDINTDKTGMKSSNKFQYTLQNEDRVAEIYATENFSENQLTYKSNNPYIGNTSKTLRYEYAFTAGILSLTGKYNQPWLLVLIKKYNAAKARNIFNKPFIEEEGYATDGVNNIAIQPVNSEYIINKKGEPVKVFGGPVFSGYHLFRNDTLVAKIDILKNTISLLHYTDDDYKLILSSISSAIMLKRIKNTEEDF